MMGSGGRDSTPWQERLGPVGDVGQNVEEIWRMMEMFFSNADRASWGATTGQGHEWDPESTYEQGYRERGAPEPLAQALGMYSQVMEPDVIGLASSLLGKGARAAQGVARAAPAPQRSAGTMQPVMNERTGRPLELWRAEMPGGAGPIATDSGFQGSGRYFGEAPYVRDLAANPARSEAMVRQAQVMGRPGAVLDVAQGGVDNADMMRRVLNSAVEQAPDPNTRRYLEGLSIQHGRGEIPDADVVRMLRNTFSGDLSGVANRSGMDSLIQFADDMADPRYLEAVVFNPNAVRDVNAPLEAAEFLQLLQGR